VLLSSASGEEQATTPKRGSVKKQRRSRAWRIDGLGIAKGIREVRHNKLKVIDALRWAAAYVDRYGIICHGSRHLTNVALG